VRRARAAGAARTRHPLQGQWLPQHRYGTKSRPKEPAAAPSSAKASGGDSGGGGSSDGGGKSSGKTVGLDSV